MVGNELRGHSIKQSGSAGCFRLSSVQPEHFQPLLYVLGAREPGENVEFVNDHVYSTISMTSVLIGAEPEKAAA